MFLFLYSLLSKRKGAAVEYERSCGCFCPLYMKRSRIQPLSMKAQAYRAQAPLHNPGSRAGQQQRG